jgi:uncharacterized membrane protein HdeD (DUF308 family)
MRISSIVIGVILVFTSVWCIAHPGATYLSLAFLLGAVMLLHGITAVFGYLSIRIPRKRGPGWLLADGMVTTILSLLVLSNQIVADSAVPVFFGLWIMHSGVARIVFSVNENHKRNWVWLLILGVICVFSGVYLFLDAIIFDFTLISLVGLTFLLQGVNMLYLGASSDSE